MDARTGTRGEATRAALIRAALEIFGRDGFHAASTRAIAGAAGVNQALIGFHFGGKKGLYMATFQQVLEGMGARMAPLLRDIAAQLDAEPAASVSNVERYLPHVHRITDALVAMLTSEESRPWARLILREQQDPSEAFETFYDGFVRAVLSVLTELIARIRNRGPNDRDVRLLVLTIVGQALVFRAASAAALRHLGRRRFDGKDVAAIQALVRANVAAMLETGTAP